MIPSLPIDSHIDQILAHLQQQSSLVIQAAPGAGKTTRIPPALLNLGSIQGEIVVVEPRRIAARMAAKRVAEEIGEKLGETVGYQVRFDEVVSSKTRIRFITEGILTRIMLSDPALSRVGCVILDEFHQRHLQSDIALALLRRLQEQRPDLKIVVMSATIDTEAVTKFLGCSKIEVKGKLFDVSISYQDQNENLPLEVLITKTIKTLLREGGGKLDGDILIFLPGATEIKRAMQACSEIAASNSLLLLPLHGELPTSEQDRVVKPIDRNKLIFSTNVAESSITIDGIRTVIDSGLAKTVIYSPWSGLNLLKVARISQSSAIQRAGRAGRTAPGRCIRLYKKRDFETRPEFETAEIRRVDLAELVLELHALGITNLEAFCWFEAPTTAAIKSAEILLQRLKALDDNFRITKLGLRMLEFPLHPRQSRILIEAESRKVSEDGSAIAALIGERDIKLSSRSTNFNNSSQPVNKTVYADSDLLLRLDDIHQARKLAFQPDQLYNLGLDVGAVLAVERVCKQIAKKIQKQPKLEYANTDEQLLISILAGYPDRVARVKNQANSVEVIFAETSMASAQLAKSSVVRNAKLIVAVDAEQQQTDSYKNSIVRIASRVEPEWLLDLFPENISEVCQTSWNEQSERVEVVEKMMYGQIVLDERSVTKSGKADVTKVLIEAAMAAGTEAFSKNGEIETFLARLELLSSHFTFPKVDTDTINSCITKMCQGCSSFAEVRQRGGLIEKLRRLLTTQQSNLLQQMAPEYTSLPGRKQVRINYQQGKKPWIESRLQDFFGLLSSPKIVGGQVTLVAHLLAPNMRPVQVTSDLTSFWQRTYKEVRKELSRKYPRHNWPEDPLVKTVNKT